MILNVFLQYGLYASIVPGFLYTVFGTIKEVTIGPTAVNALISYNYAGPSAARALTLAFWTGVIQISLAFFQMGELCLALDNWTRLRFLSKYHQTTLKCPE